MEWIRVSEGLFLKQELIGAVEILQTEERITKTRFYKIKYRSIHGNIYETEPVENIEELFISLPQEIVDVLKNK